MPNDVEARLAALGLKLPGAPSPAAAGAGRRGPARRSALGVAALRGNVPVVIDAIFDLAD